MKKRFIFALFTSAIFSASALAHDGSDCVTVVNNTGSLLQFVQLSGTVNMSNFDGSSLVGAILMPGAQSVNTYLLTTAGSHSATGFVLGSAGYNLPFPSTPYLVISLDNGVLLDGTASGGGVYSYSVSKNSSANCQGYQADAGYNVTVSKLN